MRTVNPEMLSKDYLFAVQEIIFDCGLAYSGRSWNPQFGWMIELWDDPLNMLLFGTHCGDI